MEMNARNVILFFSLKYDGDWDKIYKAIAQKERINGEQFDALTKEVFSSYVTIMDEEYPESLKKIHRPPFILFYYGDVSLLNKPSLAVIGSRKNTEYGRRNCIRIVKELPKDLVIVSGLAKGIDSIAHQSCIDNGGKTIAVLGCGIEQCYPREEHSLYDRLKHDYLVISEYPNNVPPDADNFPKRNRIIAGLSQGVFVVEATKRSGTMITIAHALEQGKDVFCLPHAVDETHNCNALIKEGAYLVESGQDILDEIKIN